jgi:hypothetical protein
MLRLRLFVLLGAMGVVGVFAGALAPAAGAVTAIQTKMSC